MTTQKAILTAIDDILGLGHDEMMKNLDLDLFESGLVDSLAMVTLISQVEENIGRKIEIKKISPESFLTINSLTDAIDLQMMV
jgi:D-alanine--poly(phosphoribitol) ligase subunit 2